MKAVKTQNHWSLHLLTNKLLWNMKQNVERLTMQKLFIIIYLFKKNYV